MDEQKKLFAFNLRKYMEIKGIDRNTLARKMDVAYTTVNEWYTGESYPRMNKILEIAKILGVDRIDLIEAEDGNIKNGIPILGMIPAGMPFEAIQEKYTIDRIQKPKNWILNANNYFALIVKGDSMAPEYNDGDIVIFKKDEQNYSGKDCCVLLDTSDATFKRVTKNANGILLEPLNIHNSTGFLPMQLNEIECVSRSLRILGVAVYHFGKIQY